jgi:hypothetical protein
MMDVSKNLNIGIIDADLLYRGTSMPNLASMKISAWHKSRGDTVTLCGGADVLLFDRIYVSKVFTDTQIPQELYSYNCIRGGLAFLVKRPNHYRPRLSIVCRTILYTIKYLNIMFTRIFPLDSQLAAVFGSVRSALIACMTELFRGVIPLSLWIPKGNTSTV